MQKDKIAWRVLAITGLNFVNYRFGRFENYFRNFFMIYAPLQLIYLAMINLWLIKDFNFTAGVTYFSLPLFSVLMWLIANCRTKEISGVLQQIYVCRMKCRSIKKSQSFIIPFLLIMFLLPFIKCIIDQIIIDIEDPALSYWTLYYQTQSKILKRILQFNGSFVYSLFCNDFPFHLAFCILILFYRCSKILSSYNTTLQSRLHTKKM